MTSESNRKLLQFALLSGIFSWAIRAYGELGVYVYKGILFARLLDGKPHISDFANHYNAALLAAKCLGSKINIYDISVQNESLKALIAPIVPEQPFYLQYPPNFFVMALPMSLLPMLAAWFAWDFIGAGLSILALWKLSRLSNLAQTNKKVAIAIALSFSSYPFWLSLELGQTSIYLLAISSFMLVFLKRRKNFLAGLFGALLMVKLQYAPLLFIFGLVFGRSKFLLGFILCAVFMLAASVFCLGIDNVMRFPQAIFQGETGASVSGVSSFMMQNFRGELVLLLKDDGASTKAISLALYGLSALLTLIACLKVDKKEREYIKVKMENSTLPVPEINLSGNFDILSSVFLLIALVSSPHTHTQDYVLLSACGILLWPWLTDSNQTRKKSAIRWILLCFPAASWLLFITQVLFAMIAVQPFFVFAIILTILICLAWAEEKR